MTAHLQGRTARLAAHAAALATVVVLTAIACLPAPWQAVGALQRGAVASGEVWRLWTAHLVHFGWRHALFDALALALLARGVLCTVPLRRLLVAGLGVAPLLSLAVLWLQPGLREYRGASGLVVALLAWLVVDTWRQRRAGRGWLGFAAAALVGKLAWEAWPGHAAGSLVLPPGVSVAWSAHLAGALLGALLGTLFPSVRTAPGPRTR